MILIKTIDIIYSVYTYDICKFDVGTIVDETGAIFIDPGGTGYIIHWYDVI